MPIDDDVRFDAHPGAMISINGRRAVRIREIDDDDRDQIISWRWVDDITRGPSSLDFEARDADVQLVVEA